MNFFLLVTLAAAGAYALSSHQRRRVGLLARHLRPYQIEKLMETLIQGYLRAMGDPDVMRRAQALEALQGSEQQLSEQLERLAVDFSRVATPLARVSRLPLGLPLPPQPFAGASFDMREALAIHARGVACVARNEAGLPPPDKAFMMTAELLLLQHTCHWFCKSKMVASARMLARHHTPYEQIVASVSPETRQAYAALTGARP